MVDGTSEAPDGHRQMALIRDELRFEIGLLHERVDALIGAEAFLTIAYTAAMSTGASWGSVVSPILAVLGLVLALLSWPGVRATVKITMGWTARQSELLERHPELSSPPWGSSAGRTGERRAEADQWRSMLFFRAAPGLFTLVWAALAVVALVSSRPGS